MVMEGRICLDMTRAGDAHEGKQADPTPTTIPRWFKKQNFQPWKFSGQKIKVNGKNCQFPYPSCFFLDCARVLGGNIAVLRQSLNLAPVFP
jgi:hypothetical protein